MIWAKKWLCAPLKHLRPHPPWSLIYIGCPGFWCFKLEHLSPPVSCTHLLRDGACSVLLRPFTGPMGHTRIHTQMDLRRDQMLLICVTAWWRRLRCTPSPFPRAYGSYPNTYLNGTSYPYTLYSWTWQIRLKRGIQLQNPLITIIHRVIYIWR